MQSAQNILVAPALMTYAEYLAAEAVSEVKHEYLAGQVWAMAGGTPEHGILAARIIILLGGIIQNRPCSILTSDVRIRVEATDLSTYPDVSVVCGPLERSPQDPHAITNPVLVVEVLSDSTEAYDRGDKAAYYRRIPSLREYLLVSQHRPRLELFRRDSDDRWSFYEAGPGNSLQLSTLDGRLYTDEVYRDPLG